MVSDRRTFRRSEIAATDSLALLFGRFFSAQLRLDEHVDVAVHDVLNVAGFRACSMILHHLVRLENVGPNLVAPGNFAFF